MPAFLEAMKEDPGYDHASQAVEYGAKLAIFMLSSVINARTEDENVYFDPFFPE